MAKHDKPPVAHGCHNCAYLDIAEAEDDSIGTCRRYAPRGFTGVGTTPVITLWPSMYEGEWCGEWAQGKEPK